MNNGSYTNTNLEPLNFKELSKVFEELKNLKPSNKRYYVMKHKDLELPLEESRNYSIYDQKLEVIETQDITKHGEVLILDVNKLNERFKREVLKHQ